jgi:hypothetical protein
VSKRLRVAVLGSTGGWHAQRLEHALTSRGHTCEFAPVTRMVGRIDGALGIDGLDACDVVIVRGIPRGSLEQVIFRVDALHVLAARGVRAVNAPGDRAHGRQVPRLGAARRGRHPDAAHDRLRARRGRAHGLRRARRRRDRQAAVRLDGVGMARVEDPDVAERVFHALEIERAVYYLQETRAGRDVRAFVVGERVVAAIERVGAGWRANMARGATAHAVSLTPEEEALCVRACEVLGADYAGVDLLGDHVIEVNGIPGWSGIERACGVDVAGELVGYVERLVGA